jgi:hypothetical protein
MVPYFLALLAEALAERGERRRAYDLLVPVYQGFTEGFDTTDLKDARALVDEFGMPGPALAWDTVAGRAGSQRDRVRLVRG